MGTDISGKISSGEACIDNDRLFQNIVESIASAVFIFQGETMRYVNPSALSITGYSKEELLAMPFWAVIHEDFQDMVKQRGRSRQAGDDIPASYDVKIVRKDGEERWVNFRAGLIDLDGKPAVLGLVEDITERIQNDERLKQYEQQRTVSNTLGLGALAGLELDKLFQITAELIAETLGVEYCKVLELQPDGKALLLRAGIGWKPGLVGHAVVGTDLESQAGYTLQSKHPVIVEDLRTDTRFSGPPLLCEHGVISGISVIIGSIERPWGVLGAHAKEHRDFSENDINFIQALANILALAIERKQVEQALQESGKRYRSLFEDAPDMIHIVDVSGRIVDANPAELKTMGYSRAEYIGKALKEIIHPNYRTLTKKKLADVLRGKSFTYETAFVTKGGTKLAVEVHAAADREGGKVVSTRAIIRDITERKQTEELLKNSEAQLSLIYQSVGDVLYYLSVEDDDCFRFISVNHAFLDATGLTKEQIVGKRIEEVIPEPAVGVVRNHYKNAIRENRIIRWEESSVFPTGEKIGDVSIAPVFNAKGVCTNLVGSVHDITERVQAELALHASEKKYRGMVMNLMEGFYRVTWDGKLQDYNVAFTNILGLDPNKDFTGIELPIFWQNPEDRKDYASEIKIHGFIKDYTVYARKLNGEKIVLQVNARLIKGENSNPLLIEGSFLDITKRTRAEAQVRKLSDAVTHAGGSILITDRAGIIEYVNPAFTKITGYSAKDAMGQTPRMLNSGNQDAAFYEHMWKTISSGNIWHGKVIDKRKDGSFFPAMLTIAPITDDKDVITHFVGSHADISELEDMEAQFHQAQKMEAIGTLVGGIAHDFNNLLAGMTGNLYLAKKKVQEQPDVVQKLDNVEQLSIRAAGMIQQLLTFARKDRVSMKALPFTSFIKETLRFIKTSVPENISLHQEICSEDLLLNGDGTQLHQVLMNLINNARDAVEHVHEPRITIRLAAFHANDGWLEHHAYFETGAYAHLSVEDNGCGIPEQQIEHLFEPFFTTKAVGKGTGLGLAMVFGAVKTHHGFVEVESSPGAGSTFHIYIPLLEQQNRATASPRQMEAASGHGEMILLVDDETHILETGREVLEALGYQVLTASNGQQAVEIFKAQPEDIDLCLLDIVMPIMGGDEAANRIRQVKPDASIIFATGYDKNLQHHMVGETVLSKPFSIVEMSQLIRRQFDA